VPLLHRKQSTRSDTPSVSCRRSRRPIGVAVNKTSSPRPRLPVLLGGICSRVSTSSSDPHSRHFIINQSGEPGDGPQYAISEMAFAAVGRYRRVSAIPCTTSARSRLQATRRQAERADAPVHPRRLVDGQRGFGAGAVGSPNDKSPSRAQFGRDGSAPPASGGLDTQRGRGRRAIPAGRPGDELRVLQANGRQCSPCTVSHLLSPGWYNGAPLISQ
jgi:hypothetical protein